MGGVGVGVALGMNERARESGEQLSALRAAQVLCGRCKHWNTIDWLTSPSARNGERCEGCDGPSSFNFA